MLLEGKWWCKLQVWQASMSLRVRRQPKDSLGQNASHPAAKGYLIDLIDFISTLIAYAGDLDRASVEVLAESIQVVGLRQQDIYLRSSQKP